MQRGCCSTEHAMPHPRPCLTKQQLRGITVRNIDELSARHDADSVFAWFRGRAHASPRSPNGDVRGRRSRVVLTPGVCASSPAVMPATQPGPHISHLQGDGGNSASLPGESTKDTVKTIRAGKAGRPASPVVHPRVHFYSARTCGCQPAPGLPCALVFFEGAPGAKLGRMRRGNANARALFEM